MSIYQSPIASPSFADSLKQLLEVAKNPSLIEAAHQKARSQLALTESEKKKADEAREFLKHYDSKATEIAGAQDQLDKQKKIHQDALAEHEKTIESYNAARLEKEEELKNRESILQDSIKTHELDRQKFVKERDSFKTSQETQEQYLAKRTNELIAKIADADASKLRASRLETAFNKKLAQIQNIGNNSDIG